MDLNELLAQEYSVTRDARFWTVVSVEEKPYECSLVMFDKPVGRGMAFPNAEANVVVSYSANKPGTSKMNKTVTAIQLKESLLRMAGILNLGEITLAFVHGEPLPIIPSEITGKLIEAGTVEVDPASVENMGVSVDKTQIRELGDRWKQFTGLGGSE